MLANFHTHTTFCDGNNTPEEVVRSAIDKGFFALGFSGHGFTPFDLEYCMKDTCGYIAEIGRLKEKYKDKIQIYLGVEEDAFHPLERDCFDYVIGSSHYFFIDGKYYPIDSDYDGFKKCFGMFGRDVKRMAESYYSNFCDYILKRKPDIVGHFDLITKYDEIDESILLGNSEYLEIAERYMAKAVLSGCLFEVNTGAVSRGYRKTPYPCENLLYMLEKYGGKIILSSDSHDDDTLDFSFEETKKMLRDIGFEYSYVLCDNEFKKDFL